VVTKLILEGWPNSKLRQLLPDRIVERYPELYVADDHIERQLGPPPVPG
jgi:hypothetical protein